MTPTTPEPGEPRPRAAETAERQPAAEPLDQPPTPTPDPGERPPSAGAGRAEPVRTRLDRAPGERYVRTAAGGSSETFVWPPLAVAVGGVVAYTVLGGVLSVTAGLIVGAGFVGWLLGRLIVGPPRATVAAVGTVVVGLLGVWLFGRLEGGDLDPIAYLDAVQGWPLVALQLLAAGGLAAASSR